MLKLVFKYDFDKDVQNFIAGTRSKNSSKPTKFQQVYIDVYGTDYSEMKVREFIEAHNLDIGFDAKELVKKVDFLLV